MSIYAPRNDGTVRGLASSFWDNMNFFGYNFTYENVFFCQTVLAMENIARYHANSDKADKVAVLAEKIKQVSTETFWDAEKGGNITSITSRAMYSISV